MDQQSPSVPSDGSALKTSEKGTKKSSKVLIPILIIIALAGVGFGVYGMFLKPEPTAPSCPTCVAENPKKPEEPTSQETPEPTEQKADQPKSNSSPLSFSRSFDNVVNNRHKDYYNKYESPSDIKIHYYNHGEGINEFYYINCNSESCKLFKENGEEYATINNFQSKIRDYYYTGFGQAYGSEELFFIMDDGSVEHIPVVEAFSERNIKSYGRIEGLHSIIKIHEVALSSYSYDNQRMGGGGKDALAEDINGNFYDLYEILHPSE